MIERIRKFDRGVAHGESVLVVVTLLLMVLFALIQAALGMFKDAGAEWAIEAKRDLEWIDPFLQVATVWLAFLGASLATHYDKHIGIDIVERLAPRVPRLIISGTTKISAGVVTIFLAMAFFTQMVDYNSATIPFELAVLADGGDVHVCDATEEQLEDVEDGRPGMLCAVRSIIQSVGGEAPVPEDEAEEPGQMRPRAPVASMVGASLYLMPVIFLVIAIRMVFKGLGAFTALATGEPDAEGGSRMSFSGEFRVSDAPPEPADDPEPSDADSSEDDEASEEDASDEEVKS